MTRFDLPPPPPGLLERSNVEIVEAFLAALAAAGANPKTVKTYRAALMDFLDWLGGRPLREVSNSDVAGWVYDRLTRGLRRPRGGGDGRGRQVTMHYYTLFLRGFLEWLGLDVKVPVVRKPRGGRVEALTAEEVRRLLAAARDPLDLLIVALLFETGLRAQEAVGLRLRDIDFQRRTIRVRNAKYGEERVVYYGALTEAALHAWLEMRRPRGDEPLLGISYSGLYKRLKSLARRAGVDPSKVRPHVLRHTFATEALRRGVPLPAVQRLLGHHDIKVTQVYLHLLDEDIRRAYEAAFGSTPPRQQPPAWQPPAAPPPAPQPQQWWPQPSQQPQPAPPAWQAPSQPPAGPQWQPPTPQPQGVQTAQLQPQQAWPPQAWQPQPPPYAPPAVQPQAWSQGAQAQPMWPQPAAAIQQPPEAPGAQPTQPPVPGAAAVPWQWPQPVEPAPQPAQQDRPPSREKAEA